MNLLREAEVQARGAWKRYSAHCRRCSVCTPVSAPAGEPRLRCSVGTILREAWSTLDDIHYDARWAAVLALVLAAIGAGDLWRDRALAFQRKHPLRAAVSS